MKTIQLFIIVLFSISSLSKIYSQKATPKNLIVYKTYEDYTSNSGINLGIISALRNSDMGGNKIFVKDENNKEIKININQYWGFSVNNFIFRMNKNSVLIPMLVLKNNEKIFYGDGYLYISKIVFNNDNGSTFIKSDGVFYSDDLNSKVFEITKIIKNEKDNPKLVDFIECIKQGKERYGAQSKLNGYLKCVNDL